MPSFFDRLRGHKASPSPAPQEEAAPPPPPVEPAFEPAPIVAGYLDAAASAQALLLEPEEQELLVLLLVEGGLQPIASVDDAEKAALIAAARSLDKHTVNGRHVAVWFGMTDFGDRIVVQFHVADTTEEARKAERSATNRLLNGLRPPTALTRLAAAELNGLLEQHEGAAESPGAAACLEAEGLSCPLQPGMPRKAAARALARHWGLPYVDAEEVEFPRDCKWALKEAFVREHNVLCFEVAPDAIRLAIPHPFMLDVAQQAATLTGKAVHVAMSSRQDIRNRADKLWPAM